MALDIRLHRAKMHAIITALAESKYANKLGFKGGTLAYFLYTLDRFSTDLDYNLLSPVHEEEFMEDIQQILLNFGAVKDMYNKKYTIFFLVDYGANQMNIKVEINKRIHKNDNFVLKNFFGSQILCMTPECMIANKLIAIIERKRIASRDLYDIYFFLKQGINIKHEIIKERTDHSTTLQMKLVKKFIQTHFNSKNLLAGLGELVNEKQKIFIKNKLISETIGLIDLYLAGG